MAEDDETTIDNSGFNNWADTVEDRLAKLQTRTLVSAGIGAAGLGVAIFGISLIGKLGKTLGQIAEVTNALGGAIQAGATVDPEMAKAQAATEANAGRAPYVPPTEPYRPDMGIDETRLIPDDAAPTAEPYDPGPMVGPDVEQLPPVFKESDNGLH